MVRGLGGWGGCFLTRPWLMRLATEAEECSPAADADSVTLMSMELVSVAEGWMAPALA